MYNPLSNKRPYGASAVGQTNEMTFTLDASIGVKSLFVIVRKGEVTLRFELPCVCSEGGQVTFKGAFVLHDWGIWHYRFEGETESGLAFFGSDTLGNAIRGDWLPEWQLTVSKRAVKTPNWAKNGVVYHIFADRFAAVEPKQKWLKCGKKGTFHEDWNSLPDIAEAGKDYRADDFFGGNVAGIVSKLPYLKGLGVSQIYLSPVFESSSNHRYDTGDYFKIDSLFGTEEEFASFLALFKENGINVVLDGVFNHTGADSVYFNKFGNYPSVGAYQSKKSPYYDWYTFYDYPEQYHCWWGSTCVPTVNKAASGWRKMVFGDDGVLEKWQRQGVKGWRLDVVDELPTDCVDTLCAKVKSIDDDALVIGEVWEDASTKISYSTWRPYFMGDELDGVMNYPFKDAILRFAKDGNAIEFQRAVAAIMNNYPKECLDVVYNSLGTHDTVRALTALSGVAAPDTSLARKNYVLSADVYALARKRLLLAAVLQYTLPGMPCVYYGDEAGVQGFEDPMNRATYPWGKEDTVILAHYAQLGKLRTEHSKVLQGETHFLPCSNGVVAFERVFEDEFGTQKLRVYANGGGQSSTVWGADGFQSVFGATVQNGAVLLAPLDFAVLVFQK